MWTTDAATLVRPVYRSLAERLHEAVRAGELMPGSKLPTHRALAYSLGISVQTVSRAYLELERRGVVRAHVGRGTFVREGAREERTPWHRLPQSDDAIDLSMLTPVRGEIHRERMRATLQAVAVHPSDEALFSFRPRATLRPHCEDALPWLARCGVRPGADRVLATNGNTAAMTVALMSAAVPGDLVVTEDLGHHTLKPLTRALGLRLSGLETDGEGIVPDAVERACRAGAVKVLYLMPTGLSAMAQVMSAGRRQALADLARRHDLWIVENDAWGPVHPDRPPPIAALAPERTFYFTGLTKCLLPGLRIAWLVVPETMVPAASNRHLVTSWMATALMAEIASAWLRDGTAAALLDWQKAALGRRNRMAAEALGAFAPLASPNGLHVWLPLPEQWRRSEDAFVAHARHLGVAVAAGSSFAIDEPARHSGIRVCLGGPSEEGLAHGLETLARLARSQPEPALLAF